MTPESALEFSLWLRQNEPALFAAVEREAATASARLNGITDFLKNIGSSLATGVSNVAKFVTSAEGMNAITSLGGAYLTTKAQSNVLQTQLALAQSGMAPAPIQNTIGANGQTIPIYTPINQPVNSQILQQLQPSILQRYGLPLALGAGALLLVLMLKR